jgi:hypothetical protein
MIFIKFVFLFSVLLFFAYGCSNKERVRPENVPVSAFYSGDPKRGGFWLDLVEIKDNFTYRYKVYGVDGELLWDTDYQLEEGCKENYDSPEEIPANFDSFGIAFIKVKNGLLSTCTMNTVKVHYSRGVKSNEYEEKCDSIFVLDSIIQDILLNPKIIGYSQRAIDSPYNILFPINYIGLSEEIPNKRNVEIKYYDETQMSALDLKGGDILFRKVEFKNNSSEVYVTVSYIGDDGDETLESNFTYSVDLDSCFWKLEQSDYIIIN